MTSEFATLRLPTAPDLAAPDGSAVRILLSRPGGSMAHFELAPGQIARAVRHRTVEEIWYILSGHGQMWRAFGRDSQTIALEPGTCLTIPVGTDFQFRNDGTKPLAAIAITMPPWPGPDEAVFVEGAWPASI